MFGIFVQTEGDGKASMEEAIVSLVKSKGYVSFPELKSAVGAEFKGEMAWGGSDQNIWYWFDMSDEFIGTMKRLVDEKKIFMHPSSFFTYLVDGEIPTVPVAKSLRAYKTPRWMPICFHVAPYKEPRKKNRAH